MYLQAWLANPKVLKVTFYPRTFWNCCKCYHKTTNKHEERWLIWDYRMYILSEWAYQTLLARKIFGIDLVFIASADFFSYIKLSFFSDLIVEKLNLEEQCEVAVEKLSSHQCYWKKVYVFWNKTFKFAKIFCLRHFPLPLRYGVCGRYDQARSKETQLRQKLYRSQILQMHPKKLKFTSQTKDMVKPQALLSTHWAKLLETIVGSDFGVMSIGKGP